MRYDFRSILTLLALPLAMGISAPAFADCVDTNPDAPGILTDMREAMLAGQYEEMVVIADPLDLMENTAKLNIVNVLKDKFASGFETCEVLIRKTNSDKVFQEISVMSKSGEPLIFLYALGATISGSETTLNFKVSDKPAQLFSALF